MVNEKRELKSFQDLNAWQQCRKVYSLIYEVTKQFPEEERFGLVPQMRRAAVSASSNIAEGFGRSAKQDKAHFYVMARGSITELQNQTILASDVKFIENASLGVILNELEIAHKLIVGLIKVTKS